MIDQLSEKQLAEKSESILKNPLFEASFDAVRQCYIDQMIMTKPEDVDKRNRYHACINGLEDVKKILTARIRDYQIGQSNEQKKGEMNNG